MWFAHRGKCVLVSTARGVLLGSAHFSVMFCNVYRGNTRFDVRVLRKSVGVLLIRRRGVAEGNVQLWIVVAARLGVLGAR